MSSSRTVNSGRVSPVPRLALDQALVEPTKSPIFQLVPPASELLDKLCPAGDLNLGKVLGRGEG